MLGEQGGAVLSAVLHLQVGDKEDLLEELAGAARQRAGEQTAVVPGRGLLGTRALAPLLCQAHLLMFSLCLVCNVYHLYICSPDGRKEVFILIFILIPSIFLLVPPLPLLLPGRLAVPAAVQALPSEAGRVRQAGRALACRAPARSNLLNAVECNIRTVV